MSTGLDRAPDVERAMTRWQREGTGAFYSGARFATERARQRDSGLVAALLGPHVAEGSLERVLDAACGPGRLAPALCRYARGYAGLDASPSMLSSHPLRNDGALAQGSVDRLPFADDSFDLVCLSRLFHYFADDATRARVLRELVRVSRQFVLLSFWDASSYAGVRRRLGLRRKQEDLYLSRRADLRRLLDAAGADVLDFRGSLRFVSVQTFLLARVR